MEGDDGDDSLVINGLVWGDLEAGEGDDTVLNGDNGDVDNIYGWSGDDFITNNGDVDGWDGIEGGWGNDTIINSGWVRNDIDGGRGSDSIFNNGMVWDDIEGGRGNDTIVNAEFGDVDNIFGDSGNDSLVNSGVVDWDMDGGWGDDTLINLGNVDGDMIGYAGNDLLRNEGLVGDDIRAGWGNDTVQIVADTAFVTGIIDGGEGPGNNSPLEPLLPNEGEIAADGDWDVLEFHVSSTDKDELDAFKALLDTKNASGGDISWNGMTFAWTNFEELKAILTWIELEAERSHSSDAVTIRVDNRLNWMDPAAPVAVYCVAGQVQIYGISGGSVGVFSLGAAMAELLADGTFETDGVVVTGSATQINVVAGGYQFVFDPALCALPASS